MDSNLRYYQKKLQDKKNEFLDQMAITNGKVNMYKWSVGDISHPEAKLLYDKFSIYYGRLA